MFHASFWILQMQNVITFLREWTAKQIDLSRTTIRFAERPNAKWQLIDSHPNFIPFACWKTSLLHSTSPCHPGNRKDPMQEHRNRHSTQAFPKKMVMLSTSYQSQIEGTSILQFKTKENCQCIAIVLLFIKGLKVKTWSFPRRFSSAFCCFQVGKYLPEEMPLLPGQSKRPEVRAAPQPLGNVSPSPCGMHSICWNPTESIRNGYHCGIDWQWCIFRDVCSSWSWKIWRIRSLEYFETLQPATTGIAYLFAGHFRKGSDLLKQAMPSEEMEYANITQKLGSYSFSHWLVCLKHLVWVSWLVGWLLK